MIDDGGAPRLESAFVKDISTCFAQDVIAQLSLCTDRELDPTSADAFERALAEAVLAAPVFTIKGGTSEVLRTIASRALVRRADR